jgi:hypothetical protein
VPRGRHARREVPVDKALFEVGPVRQVHALGGFIVHVHDQVPVEDLGDERGEGGGELGDGGETFVQGGVGGLLVQVVLALPEPAAAAPDVPVRELVHEVPDGPAGRRDVVGVEPLGDGPYGELQLAQRPAVQQAPVLGRHEVLFRVEAVYAGVGDEEGVGVPEGEEVLADGLVYLVL